jgi:hypothetical protein
MALSWQQLKERKVGKESTLTLIVATPHISSLVSSVARPLSDLAQTSGHHRVPSPFPSPFPKWN